MVTTLKIELHGRDHRNTNFEQIIQGSIMNMIMGTGLLTDRDFPSNKNEEVLLQRKQQRGKIEDI